MFPVDFITFTLHNIDMNRRHKVRSEKRLLQLFVQHWIHSLGPFETLALISWVKLGCRRWAFITVKQKKIIQTKSVCWVNVIKEIPTPTAPSSKASAMNRFSLNFLHIDFRFTESTFVWFFYCTCGHTFMYVIRAICKLYNSSIFFHFIRVIFIVWHLLGTHFRVSMCSARYNF